MHCGHVAVAQNSKLSGLCSAAILSRLVTVFVGTGDCNTPMLLTAKRNRDINSVFQRIAVIGKQDWRAARPTLPPVARRWRKHWHEQELVIRSNILVRTKAQAQ